MSEQDRIHALVEEGKISQQEAALLLETLQDTEQNTEGNIGGNTEREENERVNVSKPITPPHPPTSLPNAELVASTPPPNAPEPPSKAPPTSSAQEVTRWVTVSMLAGDLDVHVDTSLSEPVFEGKAELTRRGDNFEIRQRPRQKEGESILDNLLNWVKAGDLRVRIPAGYGLEVQSKAGDINVRDIPYLKGKLLAGDVDAQAIGGVDLVLQAGDVDVSLRLTAGEHRLKAKAGDVNVVLLAGSSVTTKGNISAGSLHVEGPFTRRESMTGGRFEGTVGAGTARLEVDLMAGDVSVKA